MRLEFVYIGSAVGLTGLIVGELLGSGSLSIVGAMVFVGFVLAGLPVMAAQLVVGTARESATATLDVDFDANK